MPHTFLGLGAILAFLAVAIGAFGAHSLKGSLSAEMLAVFETGNRYHMYHAFALLVSGWALQEYSLPIFRKAGWFFLVGIGLFSGSLYLLALSGLRWMGALTPVGGVFFLLGWLLLALGFFRLHKPSS